MQHEEDELSYPSLFHLGFSSSGALSVYPRCSSSLVSPKGPVWLMAAARHDQTVACHISCMLKVLHCALHCVFLCWFLPNVWFCFFRHTCGAVRLAAQRRAAGAKLAQKDTFPSQSAKPIMMWTLTWKVFSYMATLVKPLWLQCTPLAKLAVSSAQFQLFVSLRSVLISCCDPLVSLTVLAVEMGYYWSPSILTV